MRTKYLSYFIDSSTPLYGGAKDIIIKNKTSIGNGDSSNTMILNIPNHAGTHIDFPLHFIENGKSCNDYKSDFWIFNNPYLLNKKVDEDDLIVLNQEELKQIPFETDFLIINTGFWEKRGANQYWNNNPGLSKDLFFQLKENNPNIRIIGGDFISISAYQKRPEGRIAHKVFLGGDNPILLVEDMDLSNIENSPDKLICAPILINGADGAPVTIIGFYND
jgi:kynurenine formamidase|tara:strand:- start:979 stop:1638 length:660 start_codon:yes stop_codon:yes gene_type:complete